MPCQDYPVINESGYVRLEAWGDAQPSVNLVKLCPGSPIIQIVLYGYFFDSPFP